MSSIGASGTGTRREPEAAAVRAELEHVLASRCFEQAGRAKEFLKYVVDETLAGRGDRIKGYTIGVEVFARPADFDAQTDPLVRVEAGRLRRRLVEYYADEGSGDSVRIALPRGGYAAEFNYAPATPLAAPPPPQARDGSAESASTSSPPAPVLAASVPRVRTRLRASTVFACVAIAVLALGWLVRTEWRGTARASDPATAAEGTATLPGLQIPRRPKLLVVPFANLNGAGELDYFAYGISEEIVIGLMDFDVLVIMAARERGGDSAPDDLPSLPAESDVAYVLTGSVRNGPDRIRITSRLFAAETGVQLWSEAFDELLDVRTLVAIQEQIARRVAQTTAQPFGPIFAQEAAKAARKPAERLDTYDCVLRYRYYRRTLDAKGHQQSTACFERAVSQEPNLADAWAGLALVYLDEYLYGYDQQTREPDALARAQEAARKALDIEGANRLANLAMARVRFALGDVEGFDRAAERLLALSPNNPDDFTVIAGLRGVAGDWNRALPLLDQASALLRGERQPFVAMITALHALQTGDYEAALARALEADTPDWHVSHLILAASAALAGRDDIARREAARLRELSPTGASNVRALLEKWRPNEVLLTHLLAGLKAAGISDEGSESRAVAH